MSSYNIKVDLGYGNSFWTGKRKSIKGVANYLSRSGYYWRVLYVFDARSGKYLTRFTRRQKDFIPDKYFKWI